jgi:hypothetical protein
MGVAVWAAIRSFGLKSASERFETFGRRAVGGHGVRVHVETNPALMDTSGGYVPVSFWFAGGDAVSEPRDHAVAWWDWAKSHGGVDVNTSAVQVTIQSTLPRAIVVDPPTLHSSNLQRPPGFVRTPQGLGGGDVTPRIFLFDLDRPAQPPTYVDPSGKSRGKSFSIAANETERLIIAVTTERDMHCWSVSLPLIVDGKRMDLKVDDDGQDFRTIGESGYETIYWLMSGNGWSSDQY